MHDTSHAMREVLGGRRTLASSPPIASFLGFTALFCLLGAYETRYLEKMVAGEKEEETRRQAITGSRGGTPELEQRRRGGIGTATACSV